MSAAEALEACLEIALNRGQRRTDYKIIDQIKKGIATGNPENVHASLLATGVLFSFPAKKVYFPNFASLATIAD